MKNIIVLPEHEAMKIAAGEVVERPANIIKELLENSIDAESTAITIHLTQAGKSNITITDNGTGMTPKNVRKCFLQHATSKISSVNDLETLHTFGFRGEALASIAAVSNVTITTRDQSHDEAIKIDLSHGTISHETTASHPVGTTISIVNLFEQIPARKKFLKTNETELNAIVTIFQSTVLLQSHVHFKLYHNDKLLYNCPPTADHTDRVAQLWGPQLAESLIAVPETIKNDLTIHGSITQAQYHRYNRNQIFIFVNGRWIKNNTVIRAVLKGYKNILPPQKYPATFMFITLPQDKIDVNIHPKKEEIRFLQPRIVEQQVEKVVKAALSDFVSEHITVAPQSFVPQARPFQPQAFTPQQTINKASQPFQTVQPTEKIVQPQTGTAPQQAQFIPEKQEALESEASVIGQYHKTYILIEKSGNFILVDQHAAHERIMYESLVKNFNSIETITLLFPHIVSLTEEQVSILEPYYHTFKEHGIAIETFSKTEIIIQQTPVYLKTHMLTSLIQNMIEILATEQTFNPEQIHSHLRATIACRSSYQAGDTLSQEQMINLIKTLQKTKNRESCPHGRPTMWMMTKKEIDKQFKRDYQSQTKHTFDFL